jgi:hypothetical protein
MDACIIPTCRHILDNGSLCRCAATRGKAHCRHHLDSVLRGRRMARARRRRYPFWLAPLQVAKTLRDRANALQVGLELGDIDFPTAQTMLRALRARQSAERQIERMSKPPGTPKSYRLYQVPASYLFLQVCRKNAAQVVQNTRWEREIYTNHNSCHSPRLSR